MTTGQSGAITGHPDTEERSEGRRLLEMVSLETSAAIARRMDYSTVHRFSNGDTMEILPRRDGSTQATISRGVDGTVQTTPQGKKTPMCVCTSASTQWTRSWTNGKPPPPRGSAAPSGNWTRNSAGRPGKR